MIADLRLSDFRYSYSCVLRKNGCFSCDAIFDVTSRTRNRRPRRETQQSVHVTLVRFRGEKNRQSSPVAFALAYTSRSSFYFFFFLAKLFLRLRYDLGGRPFELKRSFSLVYKIHTNLTTIDC